MRRMAFLAILLALFLPASAEDWSVNGKVYRNVTVVEQDDDGVRISYEGGLGKLPYSDLPLNVQKRFGQDYDSLQAKKKAADLEMAKIDAQLAEQQKKQDATAAADTQKAQLAAARANPHATTSPRGVALAPAPLTVAHAAPPPPPDRYPGSNYIYNDILDKSYLDSLPIELVPSSNGANRGGIHSVVLRTVTEGRDPETPSQMEAIFLSRGPSQKVVADHDIVLLSNGERTTLSATRKEEPNVLPQLGEGYLSYDLTVDQARAIASDKNVQFSSNGEVYRVKPATIVNAQTYFFHVAALPPASSELTRIFHHFLKTLPPFVVIISQTCQYIILGAAGITVCMFFVGMSIGALRFFNTGG